MGIDAKPVDYYQRHSSGGTVGFSMMKDWHTAVIPGTVPPVEHTGPTALPDVGNTQSVDIVNGLRQARSLVWDQYPSVRPTGVTDVHIYRVMTVDTLVGFEITK